jgi:serine/threonine-protein kinase HipA
METSLLIYLNREKVGYLHRAKNDEMTFTYDEDWLNSNSAIPLSYNLPLKNTLYKGSEVRCFFAGILPEQDQRKKIAKILGVSKENEFALLEHLGGECAGAVRAIPEQLLLSDNSLNDKVLELSHKQLSIIIEELPNRPLWVGKDGVRLSLAGAQDKLPVIYKNEKFALPLEDTPSTHIIKPEPKHCTGIVSNEAFCMTLAKSVGLNVPDIKIIKIDKRPCLLVQRYDRIEYKGIITRLHQEDFCQALGYLPEIKYQEEGGPSIKEVLVLLSNCTTIPAVSIKNFVDGLIFNSLIGNADAHSKNYSLIYNNKECLLAPLYDIVCTLAWDNLSKKMAMKVGGCKGINDLEISHWKYMAKECNLGTAALITRVKEIASLIDNQLEGVQKILLKMNGGDTSHLIDIIRPRLEIYK